MSAAHEAEPDVQNAASEVPNLGAVEPAGPAYGGWVRVEGEFIRGWATDRNDRSVRPQVHIEIDGEEVAVVAADRPDAKLRELGEGDGAYGFVVMVPPDYRDGGLHALEAHVRAGAAFRLRSKQETFQAPARNGLPQVELLQCGWTGAHGRVRGRVPDGAQLELWRDGRRLDAELTQAWDGKRHDAQFTVRFPPHLVDAHPSGSLSLALAGLPEIGVPGAPLELPDGMEVEHDGDDLTVRLRGPSNLLGAAEIRVYDHGGDRLLASEPVRFEAGVASMKAPADLQGPPLVAVAIDGYEPERLKMRPVRNVEALVRNASFRAWSGEAPVAWSFGDRVGQVERGRHRFPARAIQRVGASGDYARVRIPAGLDGPVGIVRQPLAAALEPNDRGQAGLLARASAPATLTLSIEGANGSVPVATLRLRHPWVWEFVEEPFLCDRALADGVLQLTAVPETPGEPLTVDLAGLRLGGASVFDVEETAAAPTATATELVVNADLSLWPNGLSFASAEDQFETAAGWTIATRNAARPVHARAVPDPEDPDRYALAWATDEVPVSCRLEIALDSAVADLSGGLLRFTASSPPAARRLLSGTVGPAPRYSVIDRVMLVRRTTVITTKGLRIADANLTTIARRLLVAETPHAYELAVRRDLDPMGALVAGEVRGDQEFFLVFNFRYPFAVALSGVSLTQGEAPAAMPPPYLQLEDRGIAAQASGIAGLEAWLRPEIATPARLATSADDKPSSTWRWSRTGLGTVEVVVCVHNAGDETLACLRSLTSTTETPHTVHVIDDASDPAVADRLAAFVEGKPWMRLSRHERNQGYTRSADEGVRSADAEWVVLLNSDTVVTPGWLEGLLEVAAEDPETAFVGPVSNAATFQSVPELYGPDGKFAVNALPPGWTPARMAALVAEVSDRDFPETALLNGFCTLMRRSVVLDLGGFNAAAFPAGYGEENDLCTRARKAGRKLKVADHVYVHHSKSASFGGERRNELAKAGSRALKALHPDVDYDALTAAFRDLPALVRLREKVRRALAEAG